ncbi:hypothetical protein A9239_16925 [Methanosarcina sp. A14]|nr:hypothetical protein A9239_16925 [Methanosarcina sp. A14]
MQTRPAFPKIKLKNWKFERFERFEKLPFPVLYCKLLPFKYETNKPNFHVFNEFFKGLKHEFLIAYFFFLRQLESKSV